LETAKERSGLAVVIARSLSDQTLTLSGLVAAAKEHEQSSAVLAAALAEYQSRKGERALRSLVDESKIDVVELIAPRLTGKQLDGFLSSKKLISLRPIPNLTAQVSKAFDEKKLPGKRSQARALFG